MLSLLDNLCNICKKEQGLFFYDNDINNLNYVDMWKNTFLKICKIILNRETEKNKTFNNLINSNYNDHYDNYDNALHFYNQNFYQQHLCNNTYGNTCDHFVPHEYLQNDKSHILVNLIKNMRENNRLSYNYFDKMYEGFLNYNNKKMSIKNNYIYNIEIIKMNLRKLINGNNYADVILNSGQFNNVNYNMAEKIIR